MWVHRFEGIPESRGISYAVILAYCLASLCRSNSPCAIELKSSNSQSFSTCSRSPSGESFLVLNSACEDPRAENDRGVQILAAARRGACRISGNTSRRIEAAIIEVLCPDPQFAFGLCKSCFLVMFKPNLGLCRLFRPLADRSGAWRLASHTEEKNPNLFSIFSFLQNPPISFKYTILQWANSKKKPTVGKHLPLFSLLIHVLANADFLRSGRKDTAGDGMANVKVKGENFYRDAKKVGQLNMYKEGKPIRNKNGDILKAASFQSREIPNARIEPNRKWFGMFFHYSWLLFLFGTLAGVQYFPEL